MSEMLNVSVLFPKYSARVQPQQGSNLSKFYLNCLEFQHPFPFTHLNTVDRNTSIRFCCIFHVKKARKDTGFSMAWAR